MLRSMYSGISGLKNFQNKLDVIGNNISNVNTFGFKKSRVTFKDMMSQSVAGASAPTNIKGGTNPMQVGLGSTISAIDTIHTQGNLQSTGRLLDLAISGDGYFVVGNARTETVDNVETTETYNFSYTRAGNFYLDEEGALVNVDGLYVLGNLPIITEYEEAADPDVLDDPDAPPTFEYSFKDEGGDPIQATVSSIIKIPTDAKDMTIGADGTVTYIAGSNLKLEEDNGNYKIVPLGAGETVEDLIDSGLFIAEGSLVVAGKLTLAKFANTGGLQKSGNNLFQPTSNSGDPVYAFSGESGTGAIASSTLEMSNVDLSEEFTEMIVAQRAFQANTRIITTSDEVLQELVNLKR